MNANLVAIAGVPPRDMSGKLVGVGCGCRQGTGADAPPTPEQASALRWVGLGLLVVGAVGLYMVENPPARIFR
jgi:hypothetical protein